MFLRKNQERSTMLDRWCSFSGLSKKDDVLNCTFLYFVQRNGVHYPVFDLEFDVEEGERWCKIKFIADLENKCFCEECGLRDNAVERRWYERYMTMMTFEHIVGDFLRSMS